MSNEQNVDAIKAMDKLYEFEQEPVSNDKLQPGRYFAGLYAGEHTAGTEFAIGALFVMWGASAFDIFVGLLLGNLMAVLTWTFICAPIAVQTRLTLYWYLRRIAGPMTTTIYNVLNAGMYCILAGSMITVSASAVRIPFGIEPQTGWFPTDLRFVLVVICVGAVVVTLAILGFKKLAQFSSVCAPWLMLMFAAGGVAMLPWLAANTEAGQIRSFSDFWIIANTSIWTGVPPAGAFQMTLWHVAAFAWFCNLAMHGGLSDMALLRYAKRYSYGMYSALGMYLGHYMAWVAAGIMGASAAMMLGLLITEIDSGAIAFQALGYAGIIAVIIAGWTTSNPTIYRAGLAFQAVVPSQPRWLVTLIVGAVTTVIACSPFVFTQLLGFVALYGLVLAPVGAIVLTEHWIFPKLGYEQFWAARKNLLVNWPALLSWFIPTGIALVIFFTMPYYQFFLFLPVYIISSILYIVLAGMSGAKDTNLPAYVAPAPKTRPEEVVEENTNVEHDTIWYVSGAIAFICLAICAIWPLWILIAGVDGYDERFATFKTWLIVPTLIYFVSGTFWTLRRKSDNAPM